MGKNIASNQQRKHGGRARHFPAKCRNAGIQIHRLRNLRFVEQKEVICGLIA